MAELRLRLISIVFSFHVRNYYTLCERPSELNKGKSKVLL